MPRTARQHSNTEIYHIIFRGNDKQDIFYEDKDRYIFLKMLKETKQKFNLKIYSYCLMSNHVHIIIRVKDIFLSQSMKSIEVKYSRYFNKKTERSGHLFENRFFSRKVENLQYFLTVCKYVHRNPEKAKIQKTEEYKWSSYQEYIKGEKIIDTKILLNYFNSSVFRFKEYTLKNDDKEYLNKLAEFEILNKLQEDELRNIITEKFGLNFASDVGNLDTNRKDEIILYLKTVEGTNINQISRVTKVTRYYIKKLYGLQ